MLRHYETATADSQLDDRKLNLSSLETGLIMGLYSNDYWKYLNQAFTDLQASPADGTWFMRLADAITIETLTAHTPTTSSRPTSQSTVSTAARLQTTHRWQHKTKKF